MNPIAPLVTSHAEGWLSIDSSLRNQIESQLVAGEFVVAWMISDIDELRQYRATLLALTDRRIFSSSATRSVNAWPLTEVEKLRTKDRAG